MEISKYFKWEDSYKSTTAIRLGINNVPNANHAESLKLLFEKVIDRVKAEYPSVFLSSVYRCSKLNIAIGGADNSQHCKGEAGDLDSEKDNKVVFEFIRDHLEFDQLIWEFGTDSAPDWVHVSYKASGNRKQILRAVKQKGKTVYIPFK